MPTELELIALETEFELLLPFIKRLVLSLPDCRDRVRAAMWVQSLRKVKDDNFKKLRNEHTKLLLFALHRRSLVGVFEKPPPSEIESFHDGLTLMEMTRELIEITEKQKTETSGEDPTKSPLPIVVSNISADMKQYVAAQQIPKFGAHCYMAVSNEPMQMWQKSPNVKFPEIAELPNVHLWEEAFSNVDDHVLEKQAAVDKAIAIAKAIESGEMSEDELEPAVDFSKKITVEGCKAIHFKWKKDSVLNTHQSYDFSDVGVVEDVVRQGKDQLELDENAFSVLDNSLPGRQRIVVRDPYYNGLPADLGDRRLHGVLDVPPEPEDDEEEEEDDNDCCAGNGYGRQSAQIDRIYRQSTNLGCCEDMFSGTISQNDDPGCDTPKIAMNFYDRDDPCNTVDKYIKRANQFNESTPPQDLLPRVATSNGYGQGNKRLTRLQKSCNCDNKKNAGTSMTKMDDCGTDDETQWYPAQDFVGNTGGNEQKPCPCGAQQQSCGLCETQQQQIQNFQQTYNVDNFRYERGCYDIEEINMNDFSPKLENYDYSLNRPPPDEFDCCGGFFDSPPPAQPNDDRASSCCSTSVRGRY